MTTLYKKHKKSIGVWHINPIPSGLLVQHSTTLNGKLVVHREVISEGKQGRSLSDQTQHRIQSRINKQLDKGYVTTLELARNGPTNTMGLKLPMLAQQFKKVRNKGQFVCYQPKLDGHRCLVTKQDGKVIAYTRQGKHITTIEHITVGLMGTLPEGITIDGELYIHGTPLQNIGSLIKKQQPGTELLELWVYDLIGDAPFKNRYEKLSRIIKGLPSIKLTPTSFKLVDEVAPLLTKMIDRGYEGLIIRLSAKGYEDGRRSNSLVKVKRFYDNEFVVTDVIQSKEGWGILCCETTNGLPFKVSAPGTHKEKTGILDNKQDYIGKMVTVEFSMLTNNGIPFHPVALRFREDI